MPTGIKLGARANAANVVDDVVSQARRAHEIGVRQVWLAQQFDYEAIAAEDAELATQITEFVIGKVSDEGVVPILVHYCKARLLEVDSARRGIPARLLM